MNNIVRLHGGLGNQLFQLLAARYLQSARGGNTSVYTGDLANYATTRGFEIKPFPAFVQVSQVYYHFTGFDEPFTIRFAVLPV